MNLAYPFTLRVTGIKKIYVYMLELKLLKLTVCFSFVLLEKFHFCGYN